MDRTMNGASQQKFNSSNKAGYKILHPPLTTKNSYSHYTSSQKPILPNFSILVFTRSSAGTCLSSFITGTR